MKKISNKPENKDIINKYEVLAPAGSYECMLAAFNAGADAVYVGGQLFGARAFANNFTQEELIEAIEYAHLHEKKLFLTVNTLLKNQEIKEKLVEYLIPLYEAGLDAVIVQDFGVLTLVRKHFPKMDIHASTQMTITGPSFAKELKNLGVSRIVPARELSLKEIEEIYNNTKLEIECFVHGALCYSYSGLCLLSSLIGARSGNRGRCAQPCRLPYDVLFEDIIQKEQYPLSPKDLCTLKILPKILKSGVYSLKIEGRMKKPEYVASVTAMYRKYVDMYMAKGEEGYRVSDEDIKILMDIYNRGGFTNGYYEKHNGPDLMTTDRPNHMGLKVANIVNVDFSKGQIIAKAIENISKDDVLEIFIHKNSNLYVKSENVAKNKEFKIGFNSISSSKNERIDYKKIHNMLGKNTAIMRTRNNSIIKNIQETYISKTASANMLIGGNIQILKDSPISIDMWIDEHYVHLEGSKPDVAANRPTSAEDVFKQLNKTGGTGFAIDKDNFNISIEDGLFVNIKELNQLRRDAIDSLREQIQNNFRRNYEVISTNIESSNINKDINQSVKPMITALVSTYEQLKEVITFQKVDIIYVEISLLSDDMPWEDIICNAHKNNKKILFALPYITRTAARVFLEKNKDMLIGLNIDGFLFRNMESICLLKDMGIEWEYSVFDNTIYGLNDYSVQFINEYKPNMLTASYELNKSELKHLDNSSMELCVYGYIPVMITAGCIKKTYNRCDRKCESLQIKDRLGNLFINKNQCEFCYNVLYNSTPLYLFDLLEELKTINPVAYRFNFAFESAKEVREILAGNSVNNYTRGHYKRGVE